MESLLEFIVLFLKQFAGGPGPAENNLVRFGLPTIMWAVLFLVAWSRQRSQDLPRERLLVWGFGLAFLREAYMLIQMVRRLVDTSGYEASCRVVQPFEHALAMAAMVVVAGAFLLYVINNAKISRYFLLLGLGVTGLVFCLTSLSWPAQMAVNPDLLFHQTLSAWYFHIPLSLLLGAAVWMLLRRRGWLRNVVSSALIFYFLSEIVLLANYATDHAFNTILCPIGNSLHILAIPLLGYVYIREQSIEKEQAERKLLAYRDQLEKLVTERTAELVDVNRQLGVEVEERKSAEAELAVRNVSLAAQNAVAVALSQSLNVENSIQEVLAIIQAKLEMDLGLVFLLEPGSTKLTLSFYNGWKPDRDNRTTLPENCICLDNAREALESKSVVEVSEILSPSGEVDPSLDRLKITRLVSFPVNSRGSVAGVVTMGSRKPGSILPDQIEILKAVGHQIGIALENMRLFQQAERRGLQLVRLNTAASRLNTSIELEQVIAQIAHQSAWLLDSERVCILGWDEGSAGPVLLHSLGLNRAVEMEFRRMLPRLSNFLEEARTHRKLILQPSSSFNDLGNALLVPIWRSEIPREFILLFCADEDRRWQADELELIELLANRAAIALVNANLHHHIELSAALQERQRIAADMHDGLAQTLSLLGLRIDRLQELIGSGEQQHVEDFVNEIRDVVTAAAAEVRGSIASLQESPRRHASFQRKLQVLITKFADVEGTQVEWHNQLEGDLYLPPADEEQVLPIVQEAILNALNHAKADRILVELTVNEGGLRLCISDNGVGFDVEAARQIVGHYGLSIMQARAARLGGMLDINSRMGFGAQVQLRWRSAPFEKSGVSVREIQ